MAIFSWEELGIPKREFWTILYIPKIFDLGEYD